MSLWVCEWCAQSDIPANDPEKCSIRWCPKCQARTWHWLKGETAEELPPLSSEVKHDD